MLFRSAEVSESKGAEGGGSIRFKLHSKPHALALLGKRLGLFADAADPERKVTIVVRQE